MIIGNQGSYHVESISREHYELHEGNAYSAWANDNDLDATQELIIAFKTADTSEKLHVIPFYNSTGESFFELLEGPAITLDTGVAFLAVNSKYDSTNTGSVLSIETAPQSGYVTINPTITNDGTLKFKELIGQGKNKQGGNSRDTGERILKQDTIYAFRITSLGNDNIVNNVLLWYECSVV